MHMQAFRMTRLATAPRFLQTPRRHLYYCSFTSTLPHLQTSYSQQTCNHQPLRSCKIRHTTPSKTTTTRTLTTSSKMAADPYKEKNKQEPGTEEKIEDLAGFIKSSKFGMMTTRTADSDLLVSRCMAVAAQEAGGVDLIFHTNTESGKTDDLEKESNVNIAFLNGTGEWASISGKASVETDRALVKKYYSQALKTWVGDLGDGTHDGSENDPRIGVIRVEAKTATYALARGTALGRGIEMVSGAITGNAAQVNKLREISESEISQWRSSH